MAVDFNDAPEQSEGGGTPIPEDSIVKVRLTIAEPKATKQSDLHPLMSKSDKGNSYISIDAEVLAGTYAGRNIRFNNYTVHGSDEAAKISMAFFRAVVESARGIGAKDASPTAQAGRRLDDWKDLEGMEFVAKIGIEKPRVGDRFVNNRLKKAVVKDAKHDGTHYESVMAGGEHITDRPIPEVPQGGGGGSGGGGGGDEWSDNKGGTGAARKQTGEGVPSWAQPDGGYDPNDDVPF